MPTAPTTASDLRPRRDALCVLFFLIGISMASWVTRTPDMRDVLGASTAEMGLVLLGLAVGSMAGILGSGALVARHGARTVMTAGLSLIAAGVFVIGTGALVEQAIVVTAGLALVGLGMGTGEVALNVEGAAVEQALERPLLPAMHGFFSLGTVVGAGIGIGLTAIAFPIQTHLFVVAAVVIAGGAYALRAIPGGTGRRTAATSEAAAARGASVWRDRRLLTIGAIVLALALAEGAANDWLPLLMVDGHGFDPALGSAAYTLFAAAMTVGRFSGGWFIRAYGPATVLRATTLIGAAGLAVIIVVDSQVAAAAAVVLWGLGASLGFPVAISAAGESGPDSAARVSAAATMGYAAFLVGPPALGLLGEHVGLRSAMLVVLALVLVASTLTGAASARRDGDLKPAPSDA